MTTMMTNAKMLSTAALFVTLLGSGLSASDIGSAPKPKPVAIVVFSDFECPFCAQAAPVIRSIERDYGDQVRVLFLNNPLPFHHRSRLAHEAALAASAQGKFWEMHDLLFANQKKLDRADLIGYARQIGLDVVRFEKELDGHLYADVIDQDLSEGQALGVTGTPTMFVNGTKMVGMSDPLALKRAVEAALHPEKHLVSQAAPKLTTDGDYIRGDLKSATTIYAFADFQCPYCASANPVLTKLIERNPGKVRLVYKNFPLPMHPASELAHEAALAAGAQGKFWEMHDWLYEHRSNLARAELIDGAKQSGLNVERFTTELDSHKYAAQVERDRAEGTQAGVTGTPTFFIGDKKFVGALPLDAFEKAIGVSRPAPAEQAPERKAPMFGHADAPVTLLWFLDLESPLTEQAFDLVKKLAAIYPDKLDIVAEHAPLMQLHPGGELVHEALAAATAQGHGREMLDLLVANRAAVSRTDLLGYARRAGLDTGRFTSDLDKHTEEPVIERDLAEAKRLDVRGTPVFFINSVRVDGAQPLENLRKEIDRQLSARLGTDSTNGVRASLTSTQP